MADQELSALDWIAALLAGAGIVTLALAGIAISPTYRQLYSELAAAQTLPALTSLVLQSWGPALLVAPAAVALAVTGLVQSRSRRRAMIVVSFLVMLVGWGVYLWALYMPMFITASMVANGSA